MSIRLEKDQYDASLLDEKFLAVLSEQKERELFARITALTIEELPLDTIEGKITGGSINVDGSSTVRRTCNLTMVSNEIDIKDYYWGLKTKFKLEIGLKNNLKDQYAYAPGESIYPDIAWFKMGTYLITGFNTSVSTSSLSIAISGKDKGCLLNGEIGGQLPSSIDFGTEETIETKVTPVSDRPTTSIDLMKQAYYYQVTSIENPIAANSENYVFVQDNNGIFVKSGSAYYIDNNAINQKRYSGYKKVTDPSEVFIKKEDIEYAQGRAIAGWEEGETFYLKEFIIDNYTGKSTEFPYWSLVSQGYIQYQDYYYDLKQLYQVDYQYSIKKITLKQIIRESVHHYAQEPYYNILINDLEDYALEQLTYKGNTPLYALYNIARGEFTNVYLAGKNPVLDSVLAQDSNFVFLPLTSDLVNVQASIVRFNNTDYHVAKIEFGQDVGYRITDLTYTGDLISSIGDSLSSILDKIKTMLVDFEYFYDVDGHFIFQKKQTYINTSWSQITSTIEDDEVVKYVDITKDKFSFNFEGNRLLTAVQNTPQLSNVRNDFVVWGKRTTASGAEIPIHARYAIDKKPVYYKSLNGTIYTVDQKYLLGETQVKTYEEVKNDYLNQLKQFQMKNDPYEIDADIVGTTSVTAPNDDGSWAPRWWEIQDWARYYKLLTGQDPRGTMKFYSTGTNTGYLTYNQIPGVSSNDVNSGAWLLEVYNRNSSRYVNTGHGGGRLSQTQVPCNYYEDILDDDNNLIRVPAEQRQQQISQRKFTSPFSGCSDSHTYNYFLRQYRIRNASENYKVYFYNPNFPMADFETVIKEKIETEYQIELDNAHVKIVDWREIIYQMALDYFAALGCNEVNPIYDLNGEKVIETPDQFLPEVALRNSKYYPTGKTGYEQYYTDMEGFWRQLYNPDYVPVPVYSQGQYVSKAIQIPTDEDQISYEYVMDWSAPSIVDYTIDYYFTNNNITNTQYSAITDDTVKEKYEKYYVTNSNSDIKNRAYWNVAVFEAPESLNFWIDFLDSEYELAQFSVPVIGDRTKVVNEDKANAIIYKEIPGIIFLKEEGAEGSSFENFKLEINSQTGYTFANLPSGFAQYFLISYRSVSVKDKIDDLVYQHAYCADNVSLTAIPIYHLQPNTRIYVSDNMAHINGEYIVNRIGYSLAYNGTMSITASRVPQRLY